jgi:two-component system OmpR family response regulator
VKVLIIEDDRAGAEYLVGALSESGHVADAVADGMEGLHMATVGTYDALIVDRMLPSLDGLALIETLRKSSSQARDIPVIIISALGEFDERVKGLRAGGDDYLVKPYAYSELLARLEVLVNRKCGTPAETTLRVVDLEMDLLTRKVRRANRTIELKAREFLLLEYLMRNAGRVVTRTMLLEAIWDYHFDPQTNVIDVHISRLRRKIDRDFDAPLIHTIRSVGYCLREPERGTEDQ